MHKKIKQWNSGRALTRVEQLEYIVNAKHNQDLKNNPDFESTNYANNNQAVARGCSLNLIMNGHRFT